LAKFGVPVVVAINQFTSDTDAELHTIEEIVRAAGAFGMRHRDAYVPLRRYCADCFTTESQMSPFATTGLLVVLVPPLSPKRSLLRVRNRAPLHRSSVSCMTWTCRSRRRSKSLRVKSMELTELSTPKRPRPRSSDSPSKYVAAVAAVAAALYDTILPS
jgi:hypothetical protein